MSLRPAVIADIDNTLYNFVDFFGPAFRAMLHAIAAKTGLSEPVLTASFRTVYERHQSLEYPFSVQELPALIDLGLSTDSLRDIVHAARVAFGQSRKNRLRLYPGVRETLVWLKTQGYTLIAYSDGAYGHQSQRLRQLGIGHLFVRIIAWGPLLGQISRPSDPISGRIDKWFVDTEQQGSLSFDLSRRYVGMNDLKPNPQFLKELIHDMQLDLDRSWLVGDSQVKDLLPAREVGLRDVWARYGRTFEARNWDTLVSISPWREPTIKIEASNAAPFTPRYIIDAFSDLQRIIPSQRWLSPV